MARSIDPVVHAVRGFVPARTDEERFLMRHIEDLARTAQSRGIARYSGFLSDREQELARAALGRAGLEEGFRFDGGWPEAERRILCLEPEYSYPENPICCVQLQCRAQAGAVLPAHKDYLGSLMGLEIRREALGDIVLPPDAPGTAYVFALEPAARLICQELLQAGRTELATRLLAPDERTARALATIFPDLDSARDAKGAVDRLEETYPNAADTRVTPTDAAWFVDLCRRYPKPMPFVPVLDSDLLRWWGQDNLWQSQDPRYTADQVRIIPGPISVAGMTRVDEPIGELLGRFETARRWGRACSTWPR